MKCRHCQKELIYTFLDLGFSPPSNAYLTEADLVKPEYYYPLKVMVCDQCWLVQTEDRKLAHELFDPQYAYFSSVSTSWLEHAKNYADMMIKKFQLNQSNFIVEIASNDGYLLKNFIAKKIPCLGVEPTESTALVAEGLGIPVLRSFFSEEIGNKVAKEWSKADLVIGNNVYAHVPDINDFTRGLKSLLSTNGVITLEFPHLMKLLEFTQFDTIYHEHFSYLSLGTVVQIFKFSGLRVWNVEVLSTHGGSLRVYGCHEDGPWRTLPIVDDILAQEKSYGMTQLATYLRFQDRADIVKNEALQFLITQKKIGKRVAAYGAAAKGNTLLNYAGIKPDLLPFVCDAASAKQHRFMPGSHIPIFPPSVLREKRADYILILPWNISEEVVAQLSSIVDFDTKFVTLIPQLKIL
ncbi:class I SAM-dependent methyltransferase [Polynucleobacter paneuropaeus]|nr:class I SAM-dependent methyltransferase [Polynucleobacter paneuropaeus]